MAKETINISGMHCASCALTVEKYLKKLPGVNSVKVNFILQRATVEYDEKKTGREKLEKAVEAVGYSVEKKSN